MGKPDNDRRLQQARDFIDDCYQQPIDLRQIAAQAHLSPYHFLRLFRNHYDLTPHQYLTRCRIEQAKQLLRRHDATVTDVCFTVGFQSLGSFSSLFQRTVGLSPLQFRRQHIAQVFFSRRHPEVPIPICFIFKFGMPQHTQADAQFSRSRG